MNDQETALLLHSQADATGHFYLLAVFAEQPVARLFERLN